MTNEELKAAIKFIAYKEKQDYIETEEYYHIFKYHGAAIKGALIELSQLKDGTHPDMVMVPRDVMLHARHYLDGVARDAYDSSEVCEIIYRIDKAMIAAAQKGTE